MIGNQGRLCSERCGVTKYGPSQPAPRGIRTGGVETKIKWKGSVRPNNEDPFQ